MGTDRNVNDWLLKHRAKTLYSLVNFFHKDFESLATIYKNDSLSAKLYHIFETYLKIIVFGGNIFSHIPSLVLPKVSGLIIILCNYYRWDFRVRVTFSWRPYIFSNVVKNSATFSGVAYCIIISMNTLFC